MTIDARYPIPEHLLDSLVAYMETGRPTGGFLEAVLCNDLMGAMKRADDDSLAALKAIAAFVYMEVPAPAWGSREKVTAWVAAGRQRVEERQA